MPQECLLIGEGMSLMLQGISTLLGQAAQGQGQGFTSTLFMMGLIFVIFYFLLIRPVRQRQKRHQELLSELKSGDKVITQGGIHGTIKGVDDQVVQLRVAEGITIEVSKSAVANIQGEPAPTS